MKFLWRSSLPRLELAARQAFTENKCNNFHYQTLSSKYLEDKNVVAAWVAYKTTCLERQARTLRDHVMKAISPFPQ